MISRYRESVVSNVVSPRSRSRRFAGVAAIVAAALFICLSAGPAAAVDPPRWVAALYVDAQRSTGLRWMVVPGATGYKVLRSETKGAGYQEIATTQQPQYFDAKVEPGSSYYYVLQTVAGAEVSANSDEKAIQIAGQKKKTLGSPVWSKAVAQESTEFGKTSYKIGLFWQPVPGAVANNIYKSLVSGKDYQLLASNSESQYIDTAVEAGKTYYYVLTALDESFQETPYSAEQQVVVEKKKEVVVKKKIKLELKSRASKQLWSKTRGDDAGKFDLFEPYGMAERDGSLYAVSNNTNEVYVLDVADGSLLRKIGGPGQEMGQLLDPTGLAIGADDNIYVVSRVKKNIQVFSPAGKPIREIPLVVPPEFAKEYADKTPAAADLAINRKTGEIFVADTTLQRVWMLDDRGKFLRFIGEPGAKGDLGKMNNPTWLDIDPSGNIVVIDSGTTQVMTYSTDGKLIRSWGERAPGVGKFLFVTSSGFDADGNIMVVEMAAKSIQGFLPDGRYLYHVSNEDGTRNADLFAPKKLVADSRKNNRIYVAQGLANRIAAFELTGPVPPPQEEADPGQPKAP